MPKLLAVVVLIVATVPLLAQQEDAEGCKDSTMLSRMKGCAIESCDKKDFDRADIRTGATDELVQHVEGEVEIITYKCAENVSFLSIVRNVEMRSRPRASRPCIPARG